MDNIKTDVKMMTHQDGDIGCSWFQFPSQEDQLATIYRQDTIVKIPEPKG